MFVVFENIIYNLYYILQKLNTYFCTDFSEYIPQLTEELSLNISVLNLITNYKKKNL